MHLHDLLQWLLELEDAANDDVRPQAGLIAAERVLSTAKLPSGKKLSSEQRSLLKAVHDGKRSANEVYRTDPVLWWAYRCHRTDAENDLAAPLVRDTQEIVNGKLRVRSSPLNLALRELVMGGVGTRTTRRIVEGKPVQQPISEATVRLHCRNAKACFGEAVERELAPSNPFRKLASRAVAASRGRYVTAEKAELLLEACSDVQCGGCWSA